VVEYAVREFDYNALTKGKQLDLRDVDKAIDLADAVRAS